MRKAWILTRVSTWKKAQDTSPENQEAQLREYLERNGWTVAGVSHDRVSGQKGERDRPGLREALDRARTGKVQCIAVTRLDRLARNLGNLIAVSSELKRVGVSLVIADLSGMAWVDTDTPVGGYLIHLLGALAEFQARVYGDAAQAGKQRAQSRGVHCARPREEIPQSQLREIDKLRLSGWGWDAISTYLAESSMFQPSKFQPSTGLVRPERRWPPTTLRGAYERQHKIPPANFEQIVSVNVKPPSK